MKNINRIRWVGIKYFIRIFNVTFFPKSGINTTEETKPTTHSEKEFQSEPVITEDAVWNTIELYFDILDGLKWGDKMLVFGNTFL